MEIILDRKRAGAQEDNDAHVQRIEMAKARAG